MMLFLLLPSCLQLLFLSSPPPSFSSDRPHKGSARRRRVFRWRWPGVLDQRQIEEVDNVAGWKDLGGGRRVASQELLCRSGLIY